MGSSDDLAKLTEREKLCLRQWVLHRSAKEIAIDLGISHHAVEKRLKMARLKLGVATSLQAAQMLAAVEGYGQAVPHAPALAADTVQGHPIPIRPLVWGMIVMSVIVVALLAHTLQPPAVSSSATERQLLVREYDKQLDSLLAALITAAEIGPDGAVVLRHPLADQRFLVFDSGYYWQISGAGQQDFRSRSLGERKLVVAQQQIANGVMHHSSAQFRKEPLRMAQRVVRLPNSDVVWHVVVARTCDTLC